MKTSGYEYILVQYCHDSMADERLNIAVLLKDSLGNIVVRMPEALPRAKFAFPGADIGTVRSAVHAIETAIGRLDPSVRSERLGDLIPILFSGDEAGLRYSGVRVGLTDNVDGLVLELLERFVTRSDHEAFETVERLKKLRFRSSLPEKRVFHESSNEDLYRQTAAELMRA